MQHAEPVYDCVWVWGERQIEMIKKERVYIYVHKRSCKVITVCIRIHVDMFASNNMFMGRKVNIRKCKNVCTCVLLFS